MNCVAIMGATATGKSAAAITLAARFGGEIISMDSRQIYRGLDIGTGKVTATQRAAVPHHLIDILDPVQPTSAGAHARRARAALEQITARGHLPFLVGGTGLYFRALLDGLVDVEIPPAELAAIRSSFAGVDTDTLYRDLRGLDPQRASELAPADRVRITRALELIAYTGRSVTELYREAQEAAPPLGMVLRIVLTMPRTALRRRIEVRTRAMFAAGWVEEVRRLLDSGVPADAPGMQSLGYGEIATVLRGGGDTGEGLIAGVITATQQYAKRQETYFRGVAGATWVDVTEPGFESRLAEAVASQ